MDLDTILGVTIFLGFGFFDPVFEGQLWETKVLVKWIVISIGIFAFGIIFSLFLDSDFSFTYYTAQMPFFLIIFHRTLGELYRKIFKKIPDALSRHDNLIYFLLVNMSMITIPFLLDSFVVQKYLSS